ncbi:MAG TPA: hypothetical protein VGE81_10320 [Candidatus Limnocylindrales bacterium]
MRKLVTSLVLLGLSVVLMGAGVAASVPANGAGPQILTDSGLTLQLTPAMPGMTIIDSTTLECPVTFITTPSGLNLNACAFTISSTGTIQPGSLVVTMTASAITTAQVAAHKFAIEPNPGPLAYLETTSQTLYTVTGAQLPVTVDPGVAWGADAGTALDNSDMGSSIVVTYTVVAESLQGATASPTVAPTATPVPTATAFESIGGATGAPVQTVTPPPTGSASDSSNNNSVPLFALLICFLLAGLGLLAVQSQRRSVRR